MKHLLWFSGFLTLLLAGDRLGGLLLQRQADASLFRYSRLYRGEAGADLLFVGNSRGLTFYQPFIEEKTGLRTFNMSYNGLPADLAKVLVQDYLDRYPAPKKMIVDITLCDRSNDALIAAFLPFAGRSFRLDSLIHSKLPEIWRAGRVSALYRFNGEVFQRVLYHRNKTDSDWLLDRVVAPQLAAEAGGRSYDLEVHPDLVGQLQALVDSASKKGVTVELVISPYFPSFQVKNLDALKVAVEQATGLPVHDYRQALENPAFFGDFMHPNKAGAGAYIDLLLKDRVLPAE